MPHRCAKLPVSKLSLSFTSTKKNSSWEAIAWPGATSTKKLPGLLSEFRTASDRQAKVVNTQFAIFRRKAIQSVCLPGILFVKWCQFVLYSGMPNFIVRS